MELDYIEWIFSCFIYEDLSIHASDFIFYGFVYQGVWGVGLASRKCDLNRLPLGNNEESWVLRSDGGLCHNGKVVHQLNVMPDEGDIIVSVPVFVVIYIIVILCW